MWNSISLTLLEYKDLIKAIDDFKSDIDKLTRLQHTGHFPLILANKNDSKYNVTIAPDTLNVLGKIDHRFLNFKEDVIMATLDASIIDEHDVLLGHKESFKKEIHRMLSHSTN